MITEEHRDKISRAQTARWDYRKRVQRAERQVISEARLVKDHGCSPKLNKALRRLDKLATEKVD